MILLPLLALASIHQISPPKVVSADLPTVHSRAKIAVLLPSRAPANASAPGVFGTGVGHKSSYDFAFAYAPNCGGATACFLGEVSGRRGGHPAFRTKVSLRGGRTGYYKPLSCGGSCSPPEIQWVQRKVLYSIQWNETNKGGSRRTMITLANSAIGAGAR
jgi:hypothetical protein